MKLEIKHLAPYLPYELKLKCWDLTDVYYQLLGIDIDFNGKFGFVLNEKRNPLHVVSINDKPLNSAFYLNYDEVKPILRPLSNISKIIEHDGKRFKPFDVLAKRAQEYIPEKNLNKKDISELLGNYSQVEKLIEWHFDVFGLIDKGLAISYLSVFNKP